MIAKQTAARLKRGADVINDVLNYPNTFILSQTVMSNKKLKSYSSLFILY